MDTAQIAGTAVSYRPLVVLAVSVVVVVVGIALLRLHRSSCSCWPLFSWA
jgi:hypothetical protein